MKVYIHFYFESENDKVSTFNIFHFSNFEISASLQLEQSSNNCCTSQFQNLLSTGSAY